VQAEHDAFKRIVDAFTAATSVPVEITSAPNLQVSVKAAMAATLGGGPDLIWSTHADAHLYPQKLIDLGDLADHLGRKLGGWYPIATEYGTHEGAWMCLPVALSGNYMTYRVSWLKQAGFNAFPTNLADFLRLAQQLKKDKHPMGLALGPSMTDGHCWVHWLLWQFGGAVFDAANQPTINRPETVQALEYARELYPHFIDGTLTWIDDSNNKAYLAGAIGCTNNPISIYAELAAAHSPMAADTDHALYPIGPLGQPAELHIMRPMMLFKHTKFPNAAKAFMSFIMERPHYDTWLQGAAGYLSHTLKDYEALPFWTEDPKRTVFREAAARCRSFAYKGELGYAAAAILSDQIVLQMFAEAASGKRTVKEAIARAEQRVVPYLAS
ncbi:MAG: extracellular solute-binding protein, partial [Proteobacteria bacterium]|nr:extracellular solute-binding protein [Pseudomonadota bacterium]